MGIYGTIRHEPEGRSMPDTAFDAGYGVHAWCRKENEGVKRPGKVKLLEAQFPHAIAQRGRR